MFSKILLTCQMALTKFMTKMFLVGALVPGIAGNAKDENANSGDIDVAGLLNSSGAEADGGSLSNIYDWTKSMGAGTLNIAQTVFVYIAAIGFVVGAACLIIHGRNAGKLSEAKGGIGWTIAGAILGFAAVGLVIFAQTVGTSLFSQ